MADDMDEFAQTRGADDLFDDEIIPVSAEEQQLQTDVVTVEEPVPQQEIPEKPPVEKQPPRGETSQRGRGGERGRGRASGKGRGGARGGRADGTARNQVATSTSEAEPGRESFPTPDNPRDAVKELPRQEEEPTAEQAANGAETQRVPAVRGDRSATGGVRKPKLTEEELSKRIAAAKKNAAKKAAAHARAEADQASFLEREQVAAEKRRVDRANRRVMDNEREQNRQRKLNAVGGREWDSQKREEDYNPRGGGSQFRRGMHGGVSGHVRRDFDEGRLDDSAGTHLTPGYRGRGRGGGRGGRGRGSSRGPRGDGSPSKEPSEEKATHVAPEVNNEGDFPALPEGAKQSEEAAAEIPSPASDKLGSLSPASGTWADQVEFKSRERERS